MKSLTHYLNECLNEGKETFVKFKLFGCDKSKEAEEKIFSLAQKNGIYFEKIDDGFKLKLKEGQDIEQIKSELENLIEAIPEDKKEDAQPAIDKLRSSIGKMEKAVAPQEDEKDTDDTKTEEE